MTEWRERVGKPLHIAANPAGSDVEFTKMAEKILDDLEEIVEYRKVSLQIVEGDTRNLLAGRGFDQETVDQWYLRPISQDALIRRVVENREPLILSDARQDPDWGVLPGTSDVRSWVCIPFVYNDKVIGLLTLDHNEPGFYTEAIRDSLVSFAAQAVTNIRGAQRLDDRRRRRRALEIINDVAQVMISKLDTQDLLQTIVSRVASELDCTHCTLFFPREEDGGVYLLPEVSSDTRSEEYMARKFRPGEGVAGWVFEHSESVVLDNALEDPRFAPASRPQNQPRSMLVAPIRAGERAIGVLSADQYAFGWFDENDRLLVDALAQQAGIAIERSRGLELVQRVSSQILSAQSMEGVLQQIVEGAIRLTNTRAGIIYLFNEDKTEIVQSFTYAPGFEHPQPRMGEEGGITRRLIEQKEMMIFADTAQDERVSPALAEQGIRSLIGVPLVLEREVIGVLYLNDVVIRDFTEIERSLLSTLASQAAIAVRNARSYQQHIDDIIALQAINEAITVEKWSDTEALDGILHLVAEKLVERLGAAACAIRRYNPGLREFGRRIAAGVLRERVHYPPREYGASQHILRTKKPFYVSDPSVTLSDGQPVIRQEIQDEGIQAVAYLPLLSEGDVIGLFYVEWVATRDFSPNERQVLELFAGFARTAVRSAQRLQELEQQRARLVRLQQITADISAGATDLDRSLTLIVDSIDDIFEDASSEIRLYNAQKGSFEKRIAKVGVLAQEVDYDPRSEGTSSYVIECGKPFYAPDAESRLPGGQPAIREQIRERGIEAVATLPLISEGQTIGVLYANWTSPHPFSENDKQILELLADTAAIAIRNADLFRQSKRRIESLSKVDEIGRQLTSGIELSEKNILTLIYEQASLLMDTKNLYIALYEPDPAQPDTYHPQKLEENEIHGTVHFRLMYVDGAETSVASRQGGLGRTEWIIRHRQSISILTREASVKWYEENGVDYIGEPFASWLGVPMMAGDQVVGVIATYHKTDDYVYDEEDLQVLSLMASQAAIALRNVDLYQQLEGRVQELDTLRRLAEELTIGVLPEVAQTEQASSSGGN